MPKIAVLSVVAFLVAAFWFRSGAANHDHYYSNIAADEVVEFFRSSAWLDEGKQAWHIPIHGWIYEPEDSRVRKAAFAAIMKSEFGLVPTTETEANFSRRVNLMIADNERGKRIVISIAGQVFSIPESSVNGHFETTLILPLADIEDYANDSVITYEAVVAPHEQRKFAGEVMLLEPTGLSLISDIDDTVKISNINDRRGLLESTFLLDFAAVPGMASLYELWSAQGASFHFVSSSPWQLYVPLDEFLQDAGFPRSTLSLKAVRFRDRTLFDLFKKGTETKPATIQKILEAYPKRQFILVGDSGEHDPEVYSALFRKYPEQIRKIYIRNVSSAAANDERFSTLFAGIDENCWQLFDDAEAILPPD